MRIATWNVNGLRARLEYIQHWLAARSPDVVGMPLSRFATGLIASFPLRCCRCSR